MKCLLRLSMFKTQKLLALADSEAEFNFIPFHDDSPLQIKLLQKKKKPHNKPINQQINNYTDR